MKGINNYIVAVTKSDYHEILKNAGYIVYPFPDMKMLRLYPYYNYFDIIVDGLSDAAFVPGGAAVPLDGDIGVIGALLESAAPVLNPDFALSYLDNNLDMYRKVRARYLEEYGALEPMLMMFLRRHNYKQISYYLHKIKGSSFYIGAEKLYYLIENIEEGIKRKKTTEDDILFFLNYHRRVIAHCKEKESECIQISTN